jgi:hypothetical protein
LDLEPLFSLLSPLESLESLESRLDASLDVGGLKSLLVNCGVIRVLVAGARTLASGSGVVSSYSSHGVVSS